MLGMQKLAFLKHTRFSDFSDVFAQNYSFILIRRCLRVIWLFCHYIHNILSFVDYENRNDSFTSRVHVFRSFCHVKAA